MLTPAITAPKPRQPSQQNQAPHAVIAATDTPQPPKTLPTPPVNPSPAASSVSEPVPVMSNEEQRRLTQDVVGDWAAPSTLPSAPAHATTAQAKLPARGSHAGPSPNAGDGARLPTPRDARTGTPRDAEPSTPFQMTTQRPNRPPQVPRINLASIPQMIATFDPWSTSDRQLPGIPNTIQVPSTTDVPDQPTPIVNPEAQAVVVIDPNATSPPTLSAPALPRRGRA